MRVSAIFVTPGRGQNWQDVGSPSSPPNGIPGGTRRRFLTLLRPLGGELAFVVLLSFGVALLASSTLTGRDFPVRVQGEGGIVRRGGTAWFTLG